MKRSWEYELDSSSSVQVPVAGSSEHCNETFGSINTGNDYAAWSFVYVFLYGHNETLSLTRLPY
jgi:hypothetical protein